VDRKRERNEIAIIQRNGGIGQLNCPQTTPEWAVALPGETTFGVPSPESECIIYVLDSLAVSGASLQQLQ
jgi:hypothetical protein